MYDPLPSLYPVEVRKRKLESAWISWAVTSQVEETYSNIYIRPKFEKRTKKSYLIYSLKSIAQETCNLLISIWKSIRIHTIVFLLSTLQK